jgi:hypothetical protein
MFNKNVNLMKQGSMRKTVVILMIAIFFFLSSSVFAQTTSDTNKAKTLQDQQIADACGKLKTGTVATITVLGAAAGTLANPGVGTLIGATAGGFVAPIVGNYVEKKCISGLQNARDIAEKKEKKGKNKKGK